MNQVCIECDRLVSFAAVKAMDARPLVSVLLPVFNAERYIRASLLSLLRQTYKKLEIIVIDDGSTDSSATIINELASKNPVIKYFYQKNSGIVDALNFGIEKASGEFIARQDADDISAISRIEKQLTFLYSNPKCVAVSGSFLDINEAGELTGRKYEPNKQGEGDYTAYPAWEPYLPHPFLLMRGETLRKLRYRYVFHSEDADLYWRAVKIGEVDNLTNVCGFYRIHTSSISGKSIVEGRIQAVFSQLAAISAARYDILKDDLYFKREWLDECRKCTTIQQIIDVFSPALSVTELRYLQMASILKLVEFCMFRPYSLEKSDVQFLKNYFNSRVIRDKHNRTYCKNMVKSF